MKQIIIRSLNLYGVKLIVRFYELDLKYTIL